MRFGRIVVALSLCARPCVAQANLEVPVCQWGDCSKFCDPACGPGSVCSVEGKCVEQKTDEQREIDDVDQRRQARKRMGISVGAGVGSAKVEGTIDATVYALEIGVRRQLATFFGVNAHLGAAYAELSRQSIMAEPRMSGSSYSDVWADLMPHVGPFGRFYVGPELVLAYRHYAGEMVYADIPPKRINSRFRIETGGRLGLLLGNREQFDLWLQETSSVSDTTLNQTLLGFSVRLL